LAATAELASSVVDEVDCRRDRMAVGGARFPRAGIRVAGECAAAFDDKSGNPCDSTSAMRAAIASTAAAVSSDVATVPSTWRL